MRAELFIQNLLKDAMGLDAASIGPSSIVRAIRRRMTQRGISTTGEYAQLIQRSKVEFQQLIETTVIPETWFFRDGEPFQMLASLVISEWLPTRPTGRFRALSIPCSTGEEPYSIAMALMDAAIPVTRFAIDAVDISQQALAIARKGVYRANSFRGNRLEFRERYFQKQDSDYVLRESVRQAVHFQNGNLLDSNFLAGTENYDVIFCRNLLIYFDRPCQEQTIAKLKGLLKDNGVLFVGHAEAGAMMNSGFQATQNSKTFSYRKAQARQQKPSKIERRSRPQPPSPSSRLTPYNVRTLEPDSPLAQDHSFQEALALANRGQLPEAMLICENELKKKGASAPALYLLGVICDATGKLDEAAEYYRKAIYLAPDHYEAMVHLAVLMEKRGETKQATYFHARARRLTKKL